ncbi:MAG: GNAT family N-acetyltransferase [Clostridia bacterium]
MYFENYNINNKISDKDKNTIISIMLEAFPSYERRDEKRQTALFDNEHYNVLAIKSDDKTVGFMSFWDFGDFIYYEHFAVNESARNCGIGKNTLEKLIAISDGRPMIFEVEPPIDEMATRRMNFYKRNGFDDNSFPYCQMPLNPCDKPSPMVVMSKNIKLTAESFEYYKWIIYNKVYEYFE